MSALKMILAGGVAAVALVSAAPASAQYYPGNPYGGYGGSVVVQVPGGSYGGYGGYGGGYGGYGGYGNNSQAAVSQCTAAVTQRLNRSQAYGYGGYGSYGGGYGGGRVLGISRVDPSVNGGLTIRGVASSGYNAGNGGYGYGSAGVPDLTFSCRTDYRGLVVDVDIDRAQRAYGNGYQQDYPYSVYGYRRY